MTNKFPGDAEIDADPIQALHELLAIVKNRENQKYFAQPSDGFSIYDFGSPSVEPDTSTALKKAVIAYEDDIRNKDIEHGAIFNKNGDTIAISTGTKNSLYFDLTEQEETLIRNGVMTHNHPKGFTFSFEDIKTACEYRLAEIRVVTRYYRYSMKFNNNWRSRFALRKVVAESLEKANTITKQLIIADEISAAHLDYELEHQLWVVVAKEIGFTYTREKS